MPPNKILFLVFALNLPQLIALVFVDRAYYLRENSTKHDVSPWMSYLVFQAKLKEILSLFISTWFCVFMFRGYFELGWCKWWSSYFSVLFLGKCFIHYKTYGLSHTLRRQLLGKSSLKMFGYVRMIRLHMLYVEGLKMWMQDSLSLRDIAIMSDQ